MNAQLRDRITIQGMVASQDDTTGNITEAWSPMATVWADFRPATVREFITAGVSSSKVTGVFTVRYLPGVRAHMRVLHRDSVYDIEGVLHDPANGMTALPVSEVQTG